MSSLPKIPLIEALRILPGVVFRICAPVGMARGLLKKFNNCICRQGFPFAACILRTPALQNAANGAADLVYEPPILIGGPHYADPLFFGTIRKPRVAREDLFLFQCQSVFLDLYAHQLQALLQPR